MDPDLRNDLDELDDQMEGTLHTVHYLGRKALDIIGEANSAEQLCNRAKEAAGEAKNAFEELCSVLMRRVEEAAKCREVVAGLALVSEDQGLEWAHALLRGDLLSIRCLEEGVERMGAEARDKNAEWVKALEEMKKKSKEVGEALMVAKKASEAFKRISTL